MSKTCQGIKRVLTLPCPGSSLLHVNSVRRLHLEGDGLSREGLDEYCILSYRSNSVETLSLRADNAMPENNFKPYVNLYSFQARPRHTFPRVRLLPNLLLVSVSYELTVEFLPIPYS